MLWNNRVNIALHHNNIISSSCYWLSQPLNWIDFDSTSTWMKQVGVQVETVSVSHFHNWTSHILDSYVPWTWLFIQKNQDWNLLSIQWNCVSLYYGSLHTWLHIILCVYNISYHVIIAFPARNFLMDFQRVILLEKSYEISSDLKL